MNRGGITPICGGIEPMRLAYLAYIYYVSNRLV